MATNQTHLSEREALDIVHNATGYTFINPEPLYQALLTPGPLNPEGNKGLALIGSQTLRLVLATEGYRRQVPRGAIAAMIQRQANKENLADKGVSHGFDAFVLEYNAQPRTVSIYAMATMVEAILGAIYVDCDSNMFIMESVMARLGLVWVN